MEILHLNILNNYCLNKSNKHINFNDFNEFMKNFIKIFSLNKPKIKSLFNNLSKNDEIPAEDFSNFINNIKDHVVYNWKNKFLDKKLIDLLSNDAKKDNLKLEIFYEKYQNEVWYDWFKILYDDSFEFIINLKNFIKNKKTKKYNYLLEILQGDFFVWNEVENNNNTTKYEKNKNPKNPKLKVIIKSIKENLDKISINNLDIIEKIFLSVDNLESEHKKLNDGSNNIKLINQNLKNQVKEIKVENQKLKLQIRRESFKNEEDIQILNLKSTIRKKTFENESNLSQIELLKEKIASKKHKIKNLKSNITKKEKNNSKLLSKIKTMSMEIENLKFNISKSNIKVKDLESNYKIKELHFKFKANEEKDIMINSLNKENKDLNVNLMDLNNEIIRLNSKIIKYESELSYVKKIGCNNLESKRVSLKQDTNNDFLGISKIYLKNFIFSDFCILKKDEELLLYCLKFYNNIIELVEFSKNVDKDRIIINKDDITEVSHISEDCCIEIYWKNNTKYIIYLLKSNDFLKVIEINNTIGKSILFNKNSIFSYFNKCLFKDIILYTKREKIYIKLIIIYEDVFIIIDIDKNLIKLKYKEVYFKQEINSEICEDNNEIIISKFDKNLFRLKLLNPHRLMDLFELLNY